MITQQKKQTIKFIVAIAILIVILISVAILMIKYEVEGEVNMPFRLSKIVVVGTAEGVETEENDAKWNFSIYQNNDVYFYIDKAEKAQEDLLIKNVKISNIEITKMPQKGTIKTYMPNSNAGRLYSYEEQFLVSEKLEYKGAAQSSSTNLEIGSKGGTALIRFSNSNIDQYTSNKDEEIIHNGTLLQKVNTNKEEIAFSVAFDFTIETTKNKYQTRMTLDMPTGNIGEEENCYLEKTNMSDIIFKRVK